MFITISLISQIKIGSIEKNKTIVEKVIKPFDSLTNYCQHYRNNFSIEDYKNCIGTQFYLPPITKNLTCHLKHENNSQNGIKKTLIDSYYTLIDVQRYGSGSKSLFVFINQNNDTLLDKEILTDYISVPFYIKQKMLFEKKNLILIGGGFKTVDEINNKDIYMLKNSKWYCKEITILPTSQITSYPDKLVEYDMFYILTNQKGETAILPCIATYFKSNDKSLTLDSYASLVLEKDYNKKEQEKIAEEKRITEKKRIAKENYINQCVKKYGLEFGNLISQGKVKIGMNKDMCNAAWGKPILITKTTTEDKTYELWAYGMNLKLYFDNDLLIRIDE